MKTEWRGSKNADRPKARKEPEVSFAVFVQMNWKRCTGRHTGTARAQDGAQELRAN